MKIIKKNKLIINLFNKYKNRFDFNDYKLSKKVIAEVLKIEKINLKVSVNISIVGTKRIRSLNKKIRKIDKSTDVLSFPNISFNKPSNFDPIIKNKKRHSLVFDFTTNSWFLGDIVICYNKVIEQSKRFDHSIKREYSFLITHSMFHLLGYDHMIKKEEKVMLNKQNKVLNNLKILR